MLETLDEIMIVEFKQPGRGDYNEHPLEQIKEYLTKIKKGQIETFNRERLRVKLDCIFYCYIIADIEGKLKQYVSD